MLSICWMVLDVSVLFHEDSGAAWNLQAILEGGILTLDLSHCLTVFIGRETCLLAGMGDASESFTLLVNVGKCPTLPGVYQFGG